MPNTKLRQKFEKIWWGVVSFAKRNHGTAAVRAVVSYFRAGGLDKKNERLLNKLLKKAER